MAKQNEITTKDCCLFFEGCSPNEKQEKALRLFSEEFERSITDDEGGLVFSFSNKKRGDNASFAERRYTPAKGMQWFAGRWVGWAATADKKYTISVKPRFGELSLFFLLEEIFSFKVNEIAWTEKYKDGNSLFDRLIPFIWESKLAAANRYGVPRKTVMVFHQGHTVKGRLDVRRSIIPLHLKQEVVSVSREKAVDCVIANILLQAEETIRNKYKFFKPQLVENAQNVLDNIHSTNVQRMHLTENDYRNIHYKSIYETYKPVVDFSWQIIKHQEMSMRPSENQRGMGIFFDMAEIWEMFLREILRREFPDWRVSSPEIKVYEGCFYERRIIPDIVLTRGNDVLVFDAKWKRMNAERKPVEWSDLDRSDFFQIHTYIQYYKTIGMNVIAGGLLYPLSIDEDYNLGSMIANDLFGGTQPRTRFVVDGIVMKSNEIKDRESFEKSQKEFLERFSELVPK